MVNRSHSGNRGLILRSAFSPQIQALPVGHLRLRDAARKATSKYKTIGRLAGALERSAQNGPEFPRYIERQLTAIFKALFKATKEDGFRGWDKFRASQPFADPIGPYSILYFVSPKLDSLKPSIVRLPLGNLHLRVRAINALELRDVHTIGDLIESVRAGLGPLPRAGRLTNHEILESLDALARSVSPSGEVSWTSYAKARAFTILPKTLGKGLRGAQWISKLVLAFESAARIQLGTVGGDIFRSHLLSDDDDHLSLSDIGRQIGRTSELVRIIEYRIVTTLRRAIWLNDYRGCSFRFRWEFIEPLRQLSLALGIHGGHGFSVDEWKRLLTYRGCHFTLTDKYLNKTYRGRVSKSNQLRIFPFSDFEEMLERALGRPLKGCMLEKKLILKLLGFQFLDVKGKLFRPVILAWNKNSRTLRTIVKEVERILTLTDPLGVCPERLAEKLRTRVYKDAPSLRGLEEIMAAISSVAKDRSDGSYRVSVNLLKRRADQYEQVLRQEGRPMHISELGAKVNFSNPRGSKYNRPFQTVSHELSSDSRFVPCSRSGLWALSQWKHIESRSIADITEDLLRQFNKPMTEKELLTRISARRAVRKNAIGIALAYGPRFRRIAPATWALSGENQRRANSSGGQT